MALSPWGDTGRVPEGLSGAGPGYSGPLRGQHLDRFLPRRRLVLGLGPASHLRFMVPRPGAAPGGTHGVCREHSELVSEAGPLGLFCPEFPHFWPRQGPAKDPTAVCSSKIPRVWERGIFAAGKGLLKEIPCFHPEPWSGAV